MCNRDPGRDVQHAVQGMRAGEGTTLPSTAVCRSERTLQPQPQPLWRQAARTAALRRWSGLLGQLSQCCRCSPRPVRAARAAARAALSRRRDLRSPLGGWQLVSWFDAVWLVCLGCACLLCVLVLLATWEGGSCAQLLAHGCTDAECRRDTSTSLQPPSAATSFRRHWLGAETEAGIE